MYLQLCGRRQSRDTLSVCVCGVLQSEVLASVMSCHQEKELGDAWSGGCTVYKVEYRIIDLYVVMLISVPLPQQQNTT